MGPAFVGKAARSPGDSNRPAVAAHTTGQRVPITDWYDVVSNRQQGFQARPVVGG
ncbi:glutaminase domain-containing protein, partial [Actinoplanes sp. NPDC049316]|uniref:glutaminase domain-containing protein n=1 Tax=Actinoplanes sp. NPDC049316 TaxID=3154727 RepID=UPI00341F166F